MNFITFFVILLMWSLSLIFPVVLGSQQKTLSDLRRFRGEGIGGRFTVDREALERELQKRSKQDAVCGQDVMLQLPQSFPHSSYNASQKGEVTLFYETLTDHTLADELPDSLKDHVATSFQFLYIGIPVMIGTTEEHGILYLKLFTNSTKKVLVPYATSINEATQVDSIVEEEDGMIHFQLGDDVMTLQVQGKVKINDDKSVGKDFDKVIGKFIPMTNYPLPFDWDCELLGTQISFCQALSEVRCELAALGGDVCTLMTTSFSERFPTTMTIVTMTGIFQEMFPYLADTVPSKGVEAERLDREHTIGITYPCLTV